MAMMPGNIAKGRELKAFEEHINSDWNNLDDAVAGYVAAGNMDDLLTVVPILTAVELGHVRSHWFPEETIFVQGDPDEDAYWKTFEPMFEVVKEGLIRALMTASHEPLVNGKFGNPRNQYLPIDVHWICAGHAFEFVTTVGIDQELQNNGTLKVWDHHVNLLILTPGLPVTRRREEPPASLESEQIWVVKHPDVGPSEDQLGRSKKVVTSRMKNKK
jgi:hypothetical protein